MMIAMQVQKRYSRAPITEALIDFQVELPSEVALNALADMHSQVRIDYPTCQDFVHVQGQMLTEPEVTATASKSHIGYRFLSDSEKQIILARLDGLTFSRLAPYDCWDTFRDEARRVWEIYRTLTYPKNITRLAVRYINRLDLPLPLEDLKEYLRTVPEVSPDLSPQGLSGYFMQLQIPQENSGGILVLNEAIIQPYETDVVSVLLDIDLSQTGNLPNDDEELWDFLEHLHTRKNQVFEACITDRTRELIDR
jgi:uncharacterized protein (TIGR04255 family)